ncbi:proline-rich protein 2-like [Hirundo rustica]|uniref:proline-rich protein 2-like n=1 Tax=Hirundo rustica TaxID=43150 RepID=UPI001A953D76|nr:proline-rich protein 2-like [Hirundo rustica]
MGGASAGRMAPGQGGPGPRTGRAGGGAGAAARPPGSHRRREWRARPRRRRPPPPPGPAPASAPPIPAPAWPRPRLGPANPRAAPRLGHAPASRARPCEGRRRPLAARGRSLTPCLPSAGPTTGRTRPPQSRDAAEHGRGQQRGRARGITLPQSRSPLSSPPQKESGANRQPHRDVAPLPSRSQHERSPQVQTLRPRSDTTRGAPLILLPSPPPRSPCAGHRSGCRGQMSTREQRPLSGDTGMLSTPQQQPLVAASPGPCPGTHKPSQEQSTSTACKKNRPEGRSPDRALPTHGPDAASGDAKAFVEDEDLGSQ